MQSVPVPPFCSVIRSPDDAARPTSLGLSLCEGAASQSASATSTSTTQERHQETSLEPPDRTRSPAEPRGSAGLGAAVQVPPLVSARCLRRITSVREVCLWVQRRTETRQLGDPLPRSAGRMPFGKVDSEALGGGHLGGFPGPYYLSVCQVLRRKTGIQLLKSGIYNPWDLGVEGLSGLRSP